MLYLLNMSVEGNISLDFLKNIADALDSYRVRALIDAKEDILAAGIYNESQYNDILFKIIDEEKLKYTLFAFLQKHQPSSLETVNQFSQNNSLELRKVLSLLELLKAENLVLVEEIYDKIKGSETVPDKLIFKGLSINLAKVDLLKNKSMYEPVKVIFNEHVCSGCGLCAGICPVNCITIHNGEGKIDDDKCIRCGLCYFVCPRSFLPIKVVNMTQNNASDIKDYSSIGPFLEAYSAKTKIPEIAAVCQDGGVTSTALYYLFEKGKIDIAIGTKMSSVLWMPEPVLLTNKNDVVSTAGTKYVNNPNLKLLNQTRDKKRLAITGVPCMMQALLKSKIYDINFPSIKNVEYRLGIFCMESFTHESIKKICEILKSDINKVKKMNINKGKFFVHTQNHEEFSVPIKEISHLAREDCEVCFDLTSESADISIGSIGSPAGWNTVIIRTPKGKALYDELTSNNFIESKKIEEVQPGLPMLQKIADTKKNNCQKHISYKKSENKRYPLY